MKADRPNPVREEKTRKWFRPTFSIRTMLVAIAVVTAYFVLWEATKENGMETGKVRICPIPFLVIEYGIPSFGVIGKRDEPFGFQQEQKYFLWLFGSLS